MQRRIGLTGGIASGKSTVGRLLEKRGWPVLDADRYARDALKPNSASACAVVARYGAVVGDASSLNRAELGQIVFKNPIERQWLEQLVHPLVRQRFHQELQRLQNAPVVVLMVVPVHLPVQVPLSVGTLKLKVLLLIACHQPCSWLCLCP